MDQAECGPATVVALRPGDGLYLPPVANALPAPVFALIGSAGTLSAIAP